MSFHLLDPLRRLKFIFDLCCKKDYDQDQETPALIPSIPTDILELFKEVAPIWCEDGENLFHEVSVFYKVPLHKYKKLLRIHGTDWETALCELFDSFGNEPMQSCSVHHVVLSSASASVYPPSDSFDHRNFISCKYMQLYP